MLFCRVILLCILIRTIKLNAHNLCFCCHVVHSAIWRFLSSCLLIHLSLSHSLFLSHSSSTSLRTLLVILIQPRVLCTKLEWRVHCILSFTLHAHTTLQCIHRLPPMWGSLRLYHLVLCCGSIHLNLLSCPIH